MAKDSKFTRLKSEIDKLNRQENVAKVQNVSDAILVGSALTSGLTRLGQSADLGGVISNASETIQKNVNRPEFLQAVNGALLLVGSFLGIRHLSTVNEKQEDQIIKKAIEVDKEAEKNDVWEDD